MYYLLLAALLSTSLLVSASTQEILAYGSPHTPHVITEEFSAFVEGTLEDSDVRGLSLGIIKPDGSTEFGAWGNRTEHGELVDVDTQFVIGSCTKALLSASMAILMDDYAHGRNATPLPHTLHTFDWETKIKDLLPNEWMLKDQWQYEKINVRDILSHVSGLVGHDLSYGPHDSKKDVVIRQKFHDTPFELRQTFAYNSEMFMTGTYILEKYTGLPWGDFMRERIFEPLGMHSTVTAPGDAHKLSQTWGQSGRRIPLWFTKDEMSFISGAGVIMSTARDMTKYLAMLLNEGVDPTSKLTIIPKLACESITTATVISAGVGPSDHVSIIGYGLAWFRFSYKGFEVVTHHGALPGFLTRVQFFPRNGAAIVSLTNTDGGDAVNDLVVNHATDIMFGLGTEESFQVMTKPSERQKGSPTDALFGVKRPTVFDVSSANDKKLSLTLEHYAGTYFAPNYGNITFCPLVLSDHSEYDGDYCHHVRHTFATVDHAEGRNNSGSAQLVASWPRVWLQQVRLTHIAPDTFSFSPLTLFTEGYGSDTSPFSYEFEGFPGATARFVVGHDESCGAAGRPSRVLGFYACGILRDAESAQGDCMTGEGAKPGGLVWFEKV